MHKIKLISVGKTKEEWLDQAIEEYVKRLKPVATFEFLWAKNNEQLLALVEKESNAVALDAAGQQMTSEEFAVFLNKKLEFGGSRLTLVIGGAEGLPPELKKLPLISLSPMTMTHQIVRLVLLEQIYRGFEIARGSKYHK